MVFKVIQGDSCKLAATDHVRLSSAYPGFCNQILHEGRNAFSFLFSARHF